MNISKCEICGVEIIRKGVRLARFCSVAHKADHQRLVVLQRRRQIEADLGPGHIALNSGLVAFIDPEDYERASQYNWSAGFSRGVSRVVATVIDPDGTRKSVQLGRFILDAPEGLQVDHKNRNPLDNRRSNLRLATLQQNCCNRYFASTRKFKGVHWFERSKAFQSRVMANGKYYFLGYFKVAEDAARAYDRAAKKLHGEFASLNFPNEGGAQS